MEPETVQSCRAFFTSKSFSKNKFSLWETYYLLRYFFKCPRYKLSASLARLLSSLRCGQEPPKLSAIQINVRKAIQRLQWGAWGAITSRKKNTLAASTAFRFLDVADSALTHYAIEYKLNVTRLITPRNTNPTGQLEFISLD